MSRIGIKPIEVLAGVTFEIKPTEFKTTGPLGQLSVRIPHGIKISEKDNHLNVTRVSDAKTYKALHGTIRNLINNAITGVAKGFSKQLELVGIGYRGALEDNVLTLQVGYTHPVKIEVPAYLSVKIEKNTITVSGADKQAVGEFSAKIRRVRKPEPYKGKGIRYVGEQIRMKQGKAVKAAG